MRDMTAARVEQEEFDVVVDVEGGIWVRINGLWDYITDAPLVLTGCDAKAELPKQYEPYSMLDGPATRFILRALAAMKVGA